MDGRGSPTPLELVTDGDLLLLVECMLHLRGLDTVRITKVKGQADEVMVLDGRVGELVMLSSMLVLICLGSVVAGTLLFLTFIDFSLPFLELWSIMMVGMVLDLISWYGLLVPFPKNVGECMRFETGSAARTPATWESEWVAGPPVTFGADDVAHWPYTPGLLVKWVAFLGSLHWPVGGVDLGVGGISYVELLILYELSAGERLTSPEAHPRYLRPGRPISASAVPFGPSIDVWRSCCFIGALMRLRQFGWERCGHGLTCRPRETASELFLE